MKLPITAIRIKDGRRAVDDSKVRELADSMKTVGLINHITVNTNLELIAGAHRIAAARLLGWEEIDAVMWDCDDFLSELAEIDENLMRNELHYIDEGNAIKRRDELLSEMGMRAKQGRPENKGVEITPLTTADIAREMGVSKSTLYQSKQIATNILPDVQDAIKAADLPKTDALKIARLEPQLQKQVADKLTTGSESFLKVLSMKGVRIGVRVRKYSFFTGYPDEFTIRYSRPSGVKTEIHKIMDGWGDLFFYGFANEAETNLVKWTLANLDVFRAWYTDEKGIIKPVPSSGCEMKVFKWAELPGNFITNWYDIRRAT